MKKRVMALLLAVILLFSMETETLCAMAGMTESQQYGTEENAQEENSQEDNSVAENPEKNGQEDVSKEEGSQEDVSKEEGGQENGAEGENQEDKHYNTPAVENYYTVTFDFAGGQGKSGETMMNQQVKEGEVLDESVVVIPARVGYLFQGWKESTGNFYQFGQPVMGNMVLTAAWAPITYRIRFKGSGGTGNAPVELVCKYDEEKKLPKNTFVRTGCVFTGWRLGTEEIYAEGTRVKNLTDQDGAVVVLKAVWERGEYKVHFDANGGTGKMKDQAFVWGKSKNLYANKYKRTGYTYAGWNTKKNGSGTSYKNKEKVTSLSDVDGSVVTLYAMWNGIPYQIKYDGNGADSGSVKNSSHVYGKSSKLNTNKFKKRGYRFAGWNTRQDGTGKTYKNGAKIKNLTTKKNKTITLYAKWKLERYTIKYNTKGGKLAKSSRKSYTVNTKSFLLPRPTKKGYDFDGWYRDKKYKKRIGEIKQGRIGNLTLYAKWVKCTRKPKKNSAKITKCKATGTNKVQVQATVKRRIASSDDYYYLVYVNPINEKPIRMAKRVYKKKNIRFTLDTRQNQGYAVSEFGIAVRKKGKYQLISPVSYVKDPEKAAANKSKYKPGKTKKGIQFSDNMGEIDACDARQNFLNLTVSMVCNNPNVAYEYNGKTYYFNDLYPYQQIVIDCNKKDITVTMQILLDWTEGQTDLIAAKARVPGAAPFYTWNVTQNSAREKMEAMFSYVGMVFGRKNCYVSNWVLGNEVNNPNGWNYRGSMSEHAYFKSYAYAFRALYYGVRSQYANAHIFICTDNYWNATTSGRFPAKKVVTSFAEQLNKIQKGLKWNLAYHAYSFPISYTNFWKGYGITDNINSPGITMKNINVLTDFIREQYGSSVRVILSEQGYTSTWGETNQAAALAYSYYIAACNPMIDAFIIRSYSDDPVEVAQGLCMGIAGKESFEVFKYMDTPQSAQYTDKYLGVIGAGSWSEIVPGYKKSRLTKMYRKL